MGGVERTAQSLSAWPLLSGNTRILECTAREATDLLGWCAHASAVLLQDFAAHLGCGSTRGAANAIRTAMRLAER